MTKKKFLINFNISPITYHRVIIALYIIRDEIMAGTKIKRSYVTLASNDS